MEKNYELEILQMKKEIIGKIRNAVPKDGLKFNDEFYIHYIDGELATTEICKAIAWKPGKDEIVVTVKSETKGEIIEYIREDDLVYYDPYSLADILRNCEWESSIEEKMKLTQKQTEAINRFMESFKELKDANVAIINDSSNMEFCFVNKEHVEEFESLDVEAVEHGYANITKYIMPGGLDLYDSRFYSDIDNLYAKLK